MSEAPPFWFQPPGLLAWALWPASRTYGYVSGRRLGRKPRRYAKVPVICVGNLVMGGAGKTPTALALADLLKEKGHRPGFLSRGYGGSVPGPLLVNPDAHNARDVGDEPLLLARSCPTVVCADRVAGSEYLEQQPIDVIIMDDGFQNPGLHKDFSLLVVDSGRGLGNGFVFPAGPLRADMLVQLSRADAILLVGGSQAAPHLVRAAARMAKPILQAETRVRNTDGWQDLSVFAYAGIAVPEKFYRSLEAIGAQIVERKSFPDHRPYLPEECEELVQQAASANLQLATTAKDAVRLNGMGSAQDALREASRVLEIDLVFDNARQMSHLLSAAMTRFREDKRLRSEASS